MKGGAKIVGGNYNRREESNIYWNNQQLRMSENPPKVNLPTRSKLFDFHGVSMVNGFTINWENIQNFQARPDDIVIATYPKAGTTWLSYILDQLYFGQTLPERQTSVPIHERVPFLEMAFSMLDLGVDLADRLPTSPRLIKTHYPVHFLAKSFWEQNCKIIYLARNAKDSMVSFFHFDRMNMIAPDPGEWNSYHHRFMDGKVMFGSWYDHVNGWWKKKQTYSNLHYMFYEDMIEDTGREINKLCSFLGLSPSVEEKRKIIDEVQFDRMQNNKMVNYSTVPVLDFKISTFLRKGKVGDWKNHFTVAQNEAFDEDYKRKMKDPTLQFRTTI
ncbi:cytosolic sulfotransferase 1-like [Antennarius striatus]|uniref:cytosolic sulfotransferase 1-like n=1 Tax=Antennarius striatus TaxID=241820 RepID=UPI0035B222BD